jgi:CRISPR-associated protein Cmr4
MANTAQFFCIKTLTNLHVGSGDNNFGVVDNLVQRDVNTCLPTIHASSLKGALKEFFKDYLKLSQEEAKDNPFLNQVFGNIKSAGQWAFLSADLLSRPLRSDKVPYLNATSPAVLARLAQRLKGLGVTPLKELEELAKLEVASGTPLVFKQNLDGAIIEELDWKAKYSLIDVTGLTSLLGERLVLVHSADFQALDLPVIARNHLENGESKNLWYEEVVPYDSRFGWLLLADVADQKNWDIFIQGLRNPVQIGANASIGYGLCKLEHQP